MTTKQKLGSTVALSYVLLLLTNVLHAQITLPQVPKVKEGYAKINGAYVPDDKFLTMFPNFSKDGAYLFSYDNVFFAEGVWPINQGQDKDGYSGLYSFSSMDYPANAVSSAENLAGLGRILVQFTTDSASNISARGISLGNKTFTSKEMYIESATDIDRYLTLVEYVKDAKEKYEALDNSFRLSATEMLKRKQADSYSVSRVGTLEFDTSVSNAHVILQFVLVQSNMFWSNKVHERFPSHALYRLIVKDPSGEIFNNYHQAIFADAWGFNMLGTLMVRTTLPVAIENLMNRFLNDQSTLQKVSSRINEEITVRKAIPHYDSLYAYKRLFNALRSKKHQLLFDMACLGSRYTSLDASNKERENAILNRDRSLDNNLMTSTITGVGYGSWARGINRGLERNSQKLFVLNQIALSLSLEEKKFTDRLSHVFANPFDIAFVLDSRERDNRALNQMLGNLSNRKDETFASFQNTNNVVGKDFGTVYSNNLNSFFDDASNARSNSASELAESSAMADGGTTTFKNMDICQQQASTAWHNSEEYTRYKGTKLNSDASDCKAKAIELTIEHCGDKLPPKELAILKQTAANERRVADELRAASQNAVRFK